MSSVDDVRARLRQIVLELALCSSTPARTLLPATSSRRPTSQPPRKTDDVAESYRRRLGQLDDDEHALEQLLVEASDELANLKRRPLPAIGVETRAELEQRIVDVGEGFDVLTVAIALRTSEAIVRRARLTRGRDAEWGRRLPVELANGRPLAFGLELVAAGYSLRASALLSGVPRSTLHEHLPRTERAWPSATAR